MAITHKKPPQIPASTGMLPLNPARLPVVSARILLGPGVMAVMNVNTKKAERTDMDMAFSLMKEICQENLEEGELIEQLLMLQKSKSLMQRRRGLKTEIESRLEEFVNKKKS